MKESRISRRNGNFGSKGGAAGGRESKACEEMERMDEDARPKEAQTSTLNRSKRVVLGGDLQNAWLLAKLIFLFVLFSIS